MPETSPTLGLPMIDARCHDRRCGHVKNAYRLVAVCSNCRTRQVLLLSVGHEFDSAHKCVTCGVRYRLSSQGLEDDAAQRWPDGGSS